MPSLVIDIKGDESDFKRSLTSSTNAADKFGRNIKGSMGPGLEQAGRGAAAASLSFKGLGRQVAFASAAFLGGAGAVVAIKSTIGAASDLSEEINKSAVVFAGQGDQVNQWSKGLVKNFGISQRAALEAAGTFGNMLVPMGFARDKAAAMSEKMVELAGDLSSFNNASPADTLEAIRAGLAGEAEPLRKFGVFLSDARLKQEALSLGLYKGKGNLDASAKAAATYALILKDTGDAQGDFARTNTGLANSQRVISAAFENIQAQLGGLLLPTVARATSAFGDFLSSFDQASGLRAKLHVVGESIRSSIGSLREAIVEGVRAVDWNAVGEALVDGFRAAVAFMRAQFNAIDWDAVAASLGGFVVGAFNKLGGIIQSVDWESVGQELVKGLGRAIAFIGRIDWNRILTAYVNFLAAELKGLSGILLGAAETLGVAIKDGFVAGLRGFGQTVADLILGPINAVIRAVNAIEIPAHKVSFGKFGSVSSPAVDPIPDIGELSANFRGGSVVRGPTGNAGDVNARSLAAAAASAQQQADAARKQLAAASRTRNTPAAAGPLDFGLTPTGTTTTTTSPSAAATVASARAKAQAASLQALIAGRRKALAGLTVGNLKQGNVAGNAVSAAKAQAAQFRSLGLMASGEAFAPAASALRAQANKLTAAIKGTILDTDANRNTLANVRRTISKHLSGLSRETRLKMQEFLDAIADPLKDAGDLPSKFKAIDPTKLIQGIPGLDKSQRVALAQRLNGAGLAMGPGGSLSFRGGAPGGGGGARIGTVHININGADKDARQIAREVRAELLKTGSRTTGQRRGGAFTRPPGGGL